MAYSESLAERVRQFLSQRRSIGERKMFGGLCFFLHGNLLVGIWKQSLIARVGAERAVSALQADFVRKFDVTGKPMKGWVLIDPEGVDEDAELERWIEAAWEYVVQLPPK